MTLITSVRILLAICQPRSTRFDLFFNTSTPLGIDPERSDALSAVEGPKGQKTRAFGSREQRQDFRIFYEFLGFEVNKI